MVSSSVFHSVQCGHLPSHLGLAPPQALQVYWVLSLDIASTLAVGDFKQTPKWFRCDLRAGA